MPKEAESLGRLFNLAYTNSLTYSIDHPATIKGCSDFAEALIPAFNQTPLVTLLLDREALYVEETRIDTKTNVKRLLKAMSKSGIQSLSFEKGCSGAEIHAMVGILHDYQRYLSAEMVGAEMFRRQIGRIRLNYVTICKVTADQSVVDQSKMTSNVSTSKPSSPPPLSDTVSSAVENRALREIADLLSITNLLQDPSSAAEKIVCAAVSNDDARRTAAMQQLHTITQRLGQTQKNLSTDEIIGAICTLRRDLYEGLETQKELGRIARDEGTIISEIDHLTFEVIVRLAREEFRKGGISVKRLAMIIRRLSPNVKELRRLLPSLKQGLLAEGMSLGDFLELVKELRLELQDDSLAHLLEQGAKEVGLTVEEIAKTIRDNPADAARLLVLAAEIRSGARQDQKALSQMLTDYVEQISTHMVTRAASAAAPESAALMGKMIADLEQQLLSRLKAHGIADSLMQAIDQTLSQRLSKTVARAKSDWLTSLVASKPDLTATDIVHLLRNLTKNERDVKAVYDPLRAALVQKGYSDEKISEIYEKAASMVKVHNAITPHDLPRGALNINNTIYFLKREIGMYLRYRTPFSVLVVTLVAIKSSGVWRIPSADEAHAFLGQIVHIAVKMLRDLDLVGSLGSLTRSIPFIILPMTSEEGARVVKKRIEEKIRTSRFTLNDQKVEILPAVSATAFDKSNVNDLQSFIEFVKRRHAEEEQERRNRVIRSA